jgi:hypothetical protein
MLIDNTKDLIFTVTRANGLVSLDMYTSGSVLIGTIRISEKRADSFFAALKEINRASYSVFEPQERLWSTVVDSNNGTIEFEGV